MVGNELDTMHMRLGDLRNNTATSGTPDLYGMFLPEQVTESGGISGWIRGTFARFNFEPEQNFAIDGRYNATNLGFDKKFLLANGSFYSGFFIGLSQGDFDNDGRGATYGSLFAATTKIDAWSSGIYSTWFSSSGSYVDIVCEYMAMDAQIEAVDSYVTSGEMFGLSFEFGKSYKISEKLLIEPQAQLKLANVHWDGFYDGWNQLSFNDHTYLSGRVGLRGEYAISDEIRPWLYTGVQHEFTDAPDIKYVIDFSSHQYDTTAQIQAGITAKLAERVQLYGNVGYTGDMEEYHSTRMDFGLRISW